VLDPSEIEDMDKIFKKVMEKFEVPYSKKEF
jgi:hypothetical protein